MPSLQDCRTTITGPGIIPLRLTIVHTAFILALFHLRLYQRPTSTGSHRQVQFVRKARAGSKWPSSEVLLVPQQVYCFDHDTEGSMRYSECAVASTPTAHANSAS